MSTFFILFSNIFYVFEEKKCIFRKNCICFRKKKFGTSFHSILEQLFTFKILFYFLEKMQAIDFFQQKKLKQIVEGIFS